MIKLFLTFFPFFLQLCYSEKAIWNPELLVKYVKSNHDEINPNNDPYYFIDPNNYFTDKEKQIFLKEQKEIYEKKNITVILIMLNQMEEQYRSDEGIEEFTNNFTVSFFQNDTLKEYVSILFSFEDRRYRISTGEIAMKTYSDFWCNVFICNLKPPLKKHKYFNAVSDALYFLNNPWWVYFSNWHFLVIIVAKNYFFRWLCHYIDEETWSVDQIKKYLEKVKKEGQYVKSLNDTCLICLASFDSVPWPLSLSKKTSLTNEQRDLINSINGEHVVLKCKHKFHFDCLVKWMEKNNSCPICRGKVINPQERIPPSKLKPSEVIAIQRDLFPFISDYDFNHESLSFVKTRSTSSKGKGGWKSSGGASGKW